MIDQLKAVFDDNRGVSPVIGVILMVAITVILAAVIGGFVLSLGGDLQQAPQAQLSIEEVGGDIVIEHTGGDALTAGDIRVEGGDSGLSSDLSVGQSETVVTSASGQYTITVIHEPSESILVEKTLTV